MSSAQNWLQAKGFDRSGNRDGGIINPVQVVVPEGACLVRFYGGGPRKAKKDGCWWFTSYELCFLRDYLGHVDFVTGRAEGTGVLHKSGAVKDDWSSMGRFRVIRVTQPLDAYFGQGDGYYSASGAYIKGLRVLDRHRRQRFVTQVFVPDFSSYKHCYVALQEGMATDTDLSTVLNSLPNNPLSFER